jgi:hypothetical protein
MMQTVSPDHPLVLEAVDALSAAIQETTTDQLPAVIDVWRELVASLNDTHACFPDDPDRRAWLRAQDAAVIANQVLACHGRDDGGRILADAIRMLAWTHETVKRWDEAGFTPVVA